TAGTSHVPDAVFSVLWRPGPGASLALWSLGWLSRAVPQLSNDRRALACRGRVVSRASAICGYRVDIYTHSPTPSRLYTDSVDRPEQRPGAPPDGRRSWGRSSVRCGGARCCGRWCLTTSRPARVAHRV